MTILTRTRFPARESRNVFLNPTWPEPRPRSRVRFAQAAEAQRRKPNLCLTIHEPRPTCLSQCSEKILNAELAENAENEIFTPRSPRAPRFQRLWIDGCAASLSERSLGKRPRPMPENNVFLRALIADPNQKAFYRRERKDRRKQARLSLRSLRSLR